MAKAANGGGPNSDFIMLAGLGLLAYFAMRPRTAAAAQGTPVRPDMSAGTASRSYAGMGMGMLASLLRTGSPDTVASGGTYNAVNGIFSGLGNIQVGRFNAGNGPFEQAQAPGFTLGELGADNGAYTFGSPVNIDTSAWY